MTTANMAGVMATDSKLHCPECGEVVFKKVSGEATLECTHCGTRISELAKLTH
ncbi:hypothetical protein [Levilactobacillus suantsaii]|uniref:hypothetical protein n=1 Tax=Levilactobacillus suantsaii TaxID=2292255 RepID=UPI0014828C64|nr:hypothetical protein [Levilactobacillus suantsaii]QMU08826.1 hypothetical protein H3M12_03990 [Levilactobacillus suantsaii]